MDTIFPKLNMLLLSKAGSTDNKTVSTPLEYNAKLTPLDGEPISNATRYHRLIGSLIYLTITRLDISHVVGMVSKFMDAPHSVHYTAALRISDMSRAHFIMVFITPLDLLSSFMLIQMRTGQVIRLIDALSQVSISCWVLLLSRGVARSKM